MPLQKIRQSVVYELPINLQTIKNKIKTYDEPVSTFNNLPLENNDDGDIRIVLNENAIYIWSESNKQWKKNHSNGQIYSKTLFFTIDDNNKTEINTGIRFDGVGEYQTNSTTINLYLNGILQNNNGLYTVEKINEELVVKWNFSSGENTLINGDIIAIEFYYTNGTTNDNSYVTRKEFELKIKELMNKIESLEKPNVKFIVLDYAIKELNKGDEFTLTCKYNNDQPCIPVEWKSSNTSVASVENGKVRAIKNGFATITATSNEGFTDSCIIEVITTVNDGDNILPTFNDWDLKLYDNLVTAELIKETNISTDFKLIFQSGGATASVNLKGEQLSPYYGKRLEIGLSSFKSDPISDIGIKVATYKSGISTTLLDIDDPGNGEIVDFKYQLNITQDIERVRVDLRTRTNGIANTSTILGFYIKVIESPFVDRIESEIFGDNDNTDYNYTSIKHKENVVKSLMENNNCICFMNVSDYHIYEPSDKSNYDATKSQVDATVMATKILPINFVAAVGDFISPVLSKQEYIDIAGYVPNTLQNCECPVYISKGNHDVNQHWKAENPNAEVLSNQEYFDHFINKSKDNNNKIMYDKNAPVNGYYYVDNPTIKHRMIMLNSYEIRNRFDNYTDISIAGVSSNNQFVWLRDVAMDMTGKTDWTVSIHSHLAMSEGEWCHNYGSDRPYLQQIFSDFKHGLAGSMNAKYDILDQTWDFTKQGKIKLIGIFAGHVHDDCNTVIKDVNYFINCCAQPYQRDKWSGDPNPTKLPPQREKVGFNSLSQNVYIFNKDTSKLYKIKLGSGKDEVINIV